MIWMLGGRSGSTILHHNEVLMYPGTYSATQHKMWAWMNKVRKNILTNVWENISTRFGKVFKEQGFEKYLKNKVWKNI